MLVPVQRDDAVDGMAKGYHGQGPREVQEPVVQSDPFGDEQVEAVPRS